MVPRLHSKLSLSDMVGSSRLRLLFITGLHLSLLLACGNEAPQPPVGACTIDDDCDLGQICNRTRDQSAGQCICQGDLTCPDGTFCNALGVCQIQTGCRRNSDCSDASKFCDLASGECLERTECGFDAHCPGGTICDTASRKCVNGCRDSADCPLYQVCDRAGRPVDSLGICVGGVCENDTYCPWGMDCVGRTCQTPSNRDHCQVCSRGQPCSDPTSFCLVNPNYDPSRPETGASNYCGVNCTNDPDACPSGYDCGSVVLLTQDQCSDDGDCGGGGRRCAVGEGDSLGFCTCVSDADCADRRPLCFVGICANNPLMRCQTSEDCLCSRGVCTELPGGRSCTTGADCSPTCRDGGCYLGDACAPKQGLSCLNVAP